MNKEISKLIDGAVKTAKELITKNKNTLDTIANELLEKETIEKEEFAALFKK